MTEMYKRSFYEEILHTFNYVDKSIKDMQTDFGFDFGNMKSVESKYNFALNIIDEIDELKEAIDDGNIKEIRDAVSDILVFSLGLLHHSGENLYFGKKLQEWINSDYTKYINLELLDDIIHKLEFDASLVVESSKKNSKSIVNLTIPNI